MIIALRTAILLALAAVPLMAAERTAEQIAADIDRNGPVKLVATLSSTAPQDWQHVLDAIATGDEAWLDIAARLRPGTDAGTGEDLVGAVAAALKVNPDAVLPMIGPAFPMDEVCTVPLIEPSPEQLAQWKKAALQALAKAKGDTKIIRQCSDSIAAVSAQ